ncbi:MAG: hypothetical protein SAK29_03740 [Scytonema sp. PMC 1069.18]|nr:hypothetical protein [Scytonema sp. PMC 1069.18]MEC4881587.1 hypothetical protein [Scytonema sp. PMC 1070.18]
MKLGIFEIPSFYSLVTSGIIPTETETDGRVTLSLAGLLSAVWLAVRHWYGCSLEGV